MTDRVDFDRRALTKSRDAVTRLVGGAVVECDGVSDDGTLSTHLSAICGEIRFLWYI